MIRPAIMALLLLSQPAFALDEEIKAVMTNFDCIAYKLTKTQQRGEFPGEVPVWAIINEGPTNVVIWVSNGDKLAEVPPADSDHPPMVVVADERYSYSVGLSRKGSTLVHVCTPK